MMTPEPACLVAAPCRTKPLASRQRGKAGFLGPCGARGRGGLVALALAVVLGGWAGLCAPVRAGDAPAFVSGTDDLPLMPALRPLAGTGMVFDSPGGRLIEAYATGAVRAADVLAFYRDTLPQLGWRVKGPNSFARDGEVLDLDFTTGASTLTVRFSLAPGG
ncbi:hypothetical protein [Pararhodospirillum oryzae]|uniref:Uncharacterized protein n=1 Tax=Pararhodospirillum oryzae TaxID=478448 RepID=A0A512H615_9PROT|nr:hypothetical protein [Pararhodospirillum oryzae]GEO80882.1 hypothetical protein ROR02_10130 [Pararhodospirillum oryzae]